MRHCTAAACAFKLRNDAAQGSSPTFYRRLVSRIVPLSLLFFFLLHVIYRRLLTDCRIPDCNACSNGARRTVPIRRMHMPQIVARLHRGSVAIEATGHIDMMQAPRRNRPHRNGSVPPPVTVARREKGTAPSAVASHPAKRHIDRFPRGPRPALPGWPPPRPASRTGARISARHGRRPRPRVAGGRFRPGAPLPESNLPSAPLRPARPVSDASRRSPPSPPPLVSRRIAAARSSPTRRRRSPSISQVGSPPRRLPPLSPTPTPPMV